MGCFPKLKRITADLSQKRLFSVSQKSTLDATLEFQWASPEAAARKLVEIATAEIAATGQPHAYRMYRPHRRI
jgi:hypothetical protein